MATGSWLPRRVVGAASTSPCRFDPKSNIAAMVRYLAEKYGLSTEPGDGWHHSGEAIDVRGPVGGHWDHHGGNALHTMVGDWGFREPTDPCELLDVDEQVPARRPPFLR